MEAADGIDSVLLISTDITERKQAEDALQKAHAELEQQVEQRTRELIKVDEELQAEIADRKQVDRQLEMKDAHLRTIMEASPDYIWLLDKELNILYFNRAGPTQSKENLIGISIFSSLPKKKQI